MRLDDDRLCHFGKEGSACFCLCPSKAALNDSRPKTDWNLQRPTLFLDLAIESRLLIYEYLIPANIVMSYDL
jgi:hypothetical protein